MAAAVKILRMLRANYWHVKNISSTYIVGERSPDLDESINAHCSFSERVAKTTSIEKKTMDIEERGVRLRLTIVDTPGEKYHRVIYFLI